MCLLKGWICDVHQDVFVQGAETTAQLPLLCSLQLLDVSNTLGAHSKSNDGNLGKQMEVKKSPGCNFTACERLKARNTTRCHKETTFN